MYDHHVVMAEFFGKVEYGVDRHDNSVIKAIGEMQTIKYLQAQNADGYCIYVRPTLDNAQRFLLLDDLGSAEALKHKNKPGRMITESSKGNYQVWVRFDQEMSYENKKALIIVCGGDRNAKPTLDRWGRMPGFLNRKEKHVDASGRGFWARLVAITPGDTKIASVERFLSTPHAVGGSGTLCFSVPSPTPVVNRNGKIGTGRDESRMECAYAAAEIRKGRLLPDQIIENIAQHAYRRGKRSSLEACRQYADNNVYRGALEYVSR